MAPIPPGIALLFLLATLGLAMAIVYGLGGPPSGPPPAPR
jgi:hypothetical protein